jgi:Tol biopolymer transport system component
VLVYRSRYAYKTSLVWFDRNGHELGTAGLPGYGWPKLSPNEERLAVLYDSTGSGQPTLWVHDLKRNIGTQLNRQGFDAAHAWSPDGQQIVYSSQRPESGIYLRPRYSSDEELKLVESKAHMLVNDWSPDGRYLFYMNFEKGTPEIWRYDFTRRATEMFASGAEAQVSPDGKWVAHLGFTGVGALHVASMSNPSLRIQVSSGSAAQVQWRGDSKELFYIAPDKKLMAVPINIKGDMLEAGEPRALFQTRISEARLTLFQFAASKDGKRFLIHSLPREDAAAPLNLLVNWQEELKK